MAHKCYELIFLIVTLNIVLRETIKSTSLTKIKSENENETSSQASNGGNSLLTSVILDQHKRKAEIPQLIIDSVRLKETRDILKNNKDSKFFGSCYFGGPLSMDNYYPWTIVHINI